MQRAAIDSGDGVGGAGSIDLVDQVHVLRMHDREAAPRQASLHRRIVSTGGAGAASASGTREISGSHVPSPEAGEG
jgi:hypothetical protein